VNLRRAPIRPSSLRSRLTLLAALTTAITAIAVSLFGYHLARSSIRNGVDASLVGDHGRFARRLLATGASIGLNQELGTTPVFLINGAGRILRSTESGSVSADPLDVQIARGNESAQFSQRSLSGVEYRFYSAPVQASPTRGRLARFDRVNGGRGLAIAVGRDVQGMNAQLHSLAIGFSVLALTGVSLSALAVLWAVRVGTKPLRELNGVMHAIAAGADPLQHVSTDGAQEVSELAASFNQMTDSLRASQKTQQRMIDDAAHELRTPLTSMQTNLDLLSRPNHFDEATRTDILSSLQSQFLELRLLVDDLGLLSESSRLAGSSEQTPFVDVDVAEVASRAIARAKSRSSSVSFISDLETFVTRGDPDRLERAVVNVLDNASKWSPPNGTITVTLRNGELTVADQGPGVAPAERDRVFDRFWRSSATRNTPGSGLGLAIVAEVVARHRGTVRFGESPSGGAMVTIQLPRRGKPVQGS
jgi:two-component system, OmpR family, sensor histidine kinase MprB